VVGDFLTLWLTLSLLIQLLNNKISSFYGSSSNFLSTTAMLGYEGVRTQGTP